MKRTTRLLNNFFALLMIITFGITKGQSNKGKRTIDLSELTIAKIHEAYQEETFTAESLTRAYVYRITEFDSNINSITHINQEAITRAKALDLEYQQTGKLSPLHGIPIVVKDNINTIGLPTTAGSLALQNYYPEENAYVINKLEEAGAIILAKTNMSEWAFSPGHTESPTNGTTRNPYNLKFVPAGSSGGTAAAIAANFALGGLGTDTGSSIRGPSSHNSLIGFRTTMGLISREGIVPLHLRKDIVGPMCRSVEDATKILEVMVGIDLKDPITKYSMGKTPDNYRQYLDINGLKGTRIGVFRFISDRGTDNYIADLFGQAISDLDVLGAEIIDPIEIPDYMCLSSNQWCAEFPIDIESFLATYVKNDTIKTLEDIIRIGTTSEYSKMRLSEYSLSKGRYGDSKVECLDVYNDLKSIAYREAIKTVMDSLNLDAIIYPTWNNKPSRIDDFVEGLIGNNSLEISPATGQPSITVPMGFSEDNLPVGLQFLGRMYDEPTLIKLSYAYEQGTKHRKPPVLKKKGVTDLSNKEDINQSTNFDIAAKFIDAFYSFNKDSLQSTLTHANDSKKRILYYQKWAECGNYKVIKQNNFIKKNDSLVLCPITVKDDLIGALEVNYNVTDTFHLTIINGEIRSVDTTSDDPTLFYEAKDWTKQNRPKLINKACEGELTACECVKATVQGFIEFKSK